MLQAGFASTCVTPMPGKEIPGLFEQRFAEGVADDLYARAAVVDDGTTCVALVQTDTIELPESVVAAARKEAERLCGIPVARCFIAATHTHSGGSVFGGFLSKPDPEYSQYLAGRIAAAIAEAHRRRRPALVGTSTAQAEGVAFNRRFIMKDGGQRTHPGKMNPDILDPAGPADPTATVVSFADPATFEPIGCIVNFACHATHMNGVLYSADYPRWVVDTLRAVYGPEFGVVYLNGACGDVTQVDNRSSRPAEFGAYWCERTGRVVGAAAIQAIARTDYVAEASVAAASSKIRAAIRTSTAEARKAARALLARKKPTAEDVETIYAQELLEVEAMRREQPFRSLEIMGVRIADTLLWGVPAEFFQRFALEVREHSPFPHTACVELANGYNGYICTPEAFDGGGYEIRTARSSLLVPGAGGQVVRAAEALAGRMFAAAEAEVRDLANRRVWSSGADAGEGDSALDGINQLTRKRR